MKEEIKIVLVIVAVLVGMVSLIYWASQQEPSSVPVSNYSNLPTSTYLPTNEAGQSSPAPIKEAKTNTPIASEPDSITKIEKDRITKIITGVIDETIPVTEVIKKEIQSFFAKHDMTEDEILWFKIYGPALMTNYELLLYADAQQSLRTGIPTKSDSRLTLENFALSVGEMTTAEVKATDLEIGKIARGEPVKGSEIITDAVIISLYNKTKAVLSRVDLLFEK